MRSLALLLALLVTPAVAHAETTEAPAPERRWYGWQLLAVDAASITSTTVLFVNTPGSSWTVGAGAYLLTGTIAHAVHGNWDAAIMSAPVRALIPFVGGLVGMGVSCKGHTPGAMDDDCAGRGMVPGVFVGAIAVSALEAGLVSYEKVEAKPQLTPTASFSSNGATFGLAGVF